MQAIKNIIQWGSEKSGLNLSYFFSNGFWVTLRYGILAINGLLISIFFTQLGSRSLIGQYQFVISLIGILSIFALPGMATAIIKATIEGNDNAIRKALRISLRFSVLGALCIIGYGLYQYFLVGDTILGGTLVLAALMFPLYYASTMWYAPYDAKLHFRSVALRAIILNILLTLGLFSGLKMGGSVFLLISIYLGVNVACNWWYIRGVLRTINPRTSEEIDVRYGIFVSIQKFVYNLSNYLPPLLISYIFGFEFLGVFYIANTYTGLVSGFFSSLASLYIPLLFKYTRIAYARVFLQHIIVGIFLFCAALFFLRFLFVYLYGEAYQESLDLAYILSLLLLLLPLRIFLVNFFTTRNKNALVISVYIIANVFAAAIFLFMKQQDFIFGVAAYLYSLHLLIVFPLAVIYFRLRQQGSGPSSLQSSVGEIVPDKAKVNSGNTA